MGWSRGRAVVIRLHLLILAQCPDGHELRKDYPQLQTPDIHQALEYAAANLDDEIAELRTAS